MIVLGTNFGNPALPLVQPYVETIGESASLISWWHTRSADMTLSDDTISNLAPRVGSVGLEQTTESRRPTRTQNFRGVNAAMTFDGVNDYLRAASIPHNKTGAFSFCWMGRLREHAATGHTMALFSSGSQSARLQVGTNRSISWIVGSGAAVSAVGAFDWDDVVCMIGTSNQSQIRLILNGVATNPVATDNNITASNLYFGTAAADLQPSPCDQVQAMIWQRDISGDSALLSALAGLARDVYGAEIAA